MKEPVYFVHISDTHIGPTKGYERHGFVSYTCTEKLVEIINRLPQKPDFVIHTGDVVTDPHPDSNRLAADLLGQIEPPIYYTVGNHDTAAALRHYPMGPKTDLHPTELVYRFEVKGERFLVLDGRAPDELDPHGLISDEQLEIVAAECGPDGPPLTIFLHFPLWPLNSPWFDENATVINGAELHSLFKKAGSRLRGVFHGHVHQPMQTVRDGILYTCVASAFAQFSAWPNLPEPTFPDDPPGYSFVHLLPDQMIVHQHTFDR